jgi:hypothetical protein
MLRGCAQLRDAWTVRFAALAAIEPRSDELGTILDSLSERCGGIAHTHELDKVVLRTDPIQLNRTQGRRILRAVLGILQFSTAILLPAVERAMSAGQLESSLLHWALKHLWCDLSWEHRWMGRDLTSELSHVDQLLRTVEPG